MSHHHLVLVRTLAAACCSAQACAADSCMILPARQRCADCTWLCVCLDHGATRPESNVCRYFPRRFIVDRAPEASS